MCELFSAFHSLKPRNGNWKTVRR